MEFKQNTLHPAVSLLIYFAYLLAGLFLSQFLAFVFLAPFLGKEVLLLPQVLHTPEKFPQYRNAMLFLQGFTMALMFIATSVLFIYNHFRYRLRFLHGRPDDIFFLGAIVLTILSMPSISLLADWNMAMEMPGFLKFFEEWASGKEQELKALTEYLTNFSSDGQFVFGLIVIAVIPAIGEELVFRGIVQTHLLLMVKNKHVAVWVTAFLFSAIHLQFYGFLPRMMLGAFFGYLFVWTGNMLIPMTCHFINNGLTVFAIYMKNQGKLKVDLETSKDMPLTFILGSFVVFVVLMYLYKTEYEKSVRPKTPRPSRWAGDDLDVEP